MTGCSDGSWDQTPEQPGSRWIRLLLWISKTMGRRAFEVSLSPVVACYAAFAKGARQESLRYLARVKAARKQAGLPPASEPLTPYRHFRALRALGVRQARSVGSGQEAPYSPAHDR